MSLKWKYEEVQIIKSYTKAGLVTNLDNNLPIRKVL